MVFVVKKKPFLGALQLFSLCNASQISPLDFGFQNGKKTFFAACIHRELLLLLLHHPTETP
jgi:hypothetical protein